MNCGFLEPRSLFGSMRVFAWSDLHADYAENWQILERLSATDYRDDALLLAGDVCHDLGIFEQVLTLLGEKFAEVFFVPGNHDLWVRRGAGDSAAKLGQLDRLARSLGIKTTAAKLATGPSEVWVVPLLSWYALPEEGDASLFVAAEGPDVGLAGWADRTRVRWPTGRSMSLDLLRRNEEAWPRIEPQATVLSFSHFLPRRELMRSRSMPTSKSRPSGKPFFNFSRVAGSRDLDHQLRTLGSSVHVYGHQHRNRDRRIDGVRYIAHSLGYPRERSAGYLAENCLAPRMVWPVGT